MKKFNLTLSATWMAISLIAQTTAGFENLALPIDTFWNGSDLTGGFNSGYASFQNDYNQQWGSWSGFGYSTMRDSLTAGYLNQYSAITASGYNSSTYAVVSAYGNVRTVLNGNSAGKLVSGFYVTNATYAYLSMRDGDMFAKKFGGASGTDPDWFKLTITAFRNGALKQNFVYVYLADFRSADSTEDYILKNWQWVDLITLGEVDSLEFNLTSSDTGSFGMNTPAYFCMDNFVTLDVANSAPVAANDFVTIDYITDTIVNVMVNDIDATATPLSVSIAGGPLVPGATAVITNNHIHYTPQVGVLAIDTINYRVCDVLGACDTALLILHITGVNAIHQIADRNSIVYPNPFSTQLNVTTPIGDEIVVFNTLGEVVYAQRAVSANQTVDTGTWPTGLYFLKGRTQTQKIIKQ